MCDGRLSASSPPGGSRRLFRGFPFRWVLHCLHCIIQYLAPGKILLMNVGVHAIHFLAVSFLSCGFRCNQSILVVETKSAMDIDLTCPIKAGTCLRVGPISLDWPVDAFAIFDHSRPSFPATTNNETLFQLPLVPVGSGILFKQHRRYYRVFCRVGWAWPSPFWRSAMYYLQHQGSCWICLHQNRSQTQIFQKTLTPTFCVSKKYMERTSIFRLW